MALTLLTGVTGSGKSYQAVTMMMDSLNKDRKVFSNIELIGIDNKNYHYIDELEVRKFIAFIEDTFKQVDSLPIQKKVIRDSIYFETDFYIDEAHLVGFEKNTVGVKNWLTLQRHFFQNVYVITQVPTNIHRDYLPHFHGHIQMIAQKKRLVKDSLGLKEYESYKGDRLRTSYFKPNLDIFEIYDSGAVEQGSNKDVRTLAFVGIGLLVLFIGLGYNITSLFGSARNVSADLNDTIQTGFVSKDLSPKKEDINNTIETFSILADTKTGVYFEGVKYTYNKFLFYILPKYKQISQSVIMSNKDFKMIKYTLAEK